MCKSHPGGTGFAGMKGSWTAAEAQPCEKSAEAIAVEGPGLKGSC